MFQSHHQPSGSLSIFNQGRSPLLTRYPVLMPIFLLSGSIILGIVSLFVDSLFPLLAFVGTPSMLLCLSLAFVLGVSGILISIISIIERVDRHCLRAANFAQPKEHSYANRN